MGNIFLTRSPRGGYCIRRRYGPARVEILVDRLDFVLARAVLANESAALRRS